MKHFSTDELRTLEMLEIKGGNGNNDDVIQNQCPNNVLGCACSIEVPTNPR